MITIRASMLDDWRRYIDGDMDSESLRKRLFAFREATPAMEAGTALGAYLASQPIWEPSSHILELHDPDDSSIHFGVFNGHRFDFAADIEIPPLQNPEIEQTRRYVLDDGGVVLLSGHVDGFDGYAVDENKLTQQLDAERYADSYQWRAYLVLFGAKLVNYNVFVAKEMGECLYGGETLQRWLIRDFRRFQFYRYPEIENDVGREVLSFARFIRAISAPCSHPGPVDQMKPSDVAGEPPYIEEVCGGCSKPWIEIERERGEG